MSSNFKYRYRNRLLGRVPPYPAWSHSFELSAHTSSLTRHEERAEYQRAVSPIPQFCILLIGVSLPRTHATHVNAKMSIQSRDILLSLRYFSYACTKTKFLVILMNVHQFCFSGNMFWTCANNLMRILKFVNETRSHHWAECGCAPPFVCVILSYIRVFLILPNRKLLFPIVKYDVEKVIILLNHLILRHTHLYDQLGIECNILLHYQITVWRNPSPGTDGLYQCLGVDTSVWWCHVISLM